jgi:hypothetical protein
LDALHKRLHSKILINTKQFLHIALCHLYNPSDYLRLPSYENRLKIMNSESLQSKKENLSAVFIFNIFRDGVISTVLKGDV